jgi:hypothetical protein
MTKKTGESILACLVFIALFGTSSPSLWGAASDAVDGCEVFRHPEQFYGKTIQIRGAFVIYTESASLYGYPKCVGVEFPLAQIRGATTETVRAWRKGGGFDGAWMFSDMTGRFDRNSNGGYLFNIESLVVLRRVKPYSMK